MVAQAVNVAGKRVVIIEESEYLDLLRRAGVGVGADALPPLPVPDKDGNVPALEYARASLARDIVTERKRLGLSQKDLARLAGMNVETLNRIERATVTASVASVDRIDRTLKRIAAETAGRRNDPRPRRDPSGTTRTNREPGRVFGSKGARSRKANAAGGK